jgi:hypothetical protein
MTQLRRHVLDAAELHCLRTDGFYFSKEFVPALHGGDVYAREFVASWNHLPHDPYVTRPYGFRLRRFDSFRYHERAGDLEPLPTEPFVQHRDVNWLYGDLLRVFAGLTERTTANPLLAELIRSDCAVFGASRPSFPILKVGVHQIRIEARVGCPVSPTPEGIHRDGHEFVATHLIARHGCLGAESVVYDSQKRELARRALLNPFDTLFIHDSRVFHYVTELRADANVDATWRDVLVITLDAAESDTTPDPTAAATAHKRSVRRFKR